MALLPDIDNIWQCCEIPHVDNAEWEAIVEQLWKLGSQLLTCGFAAEAQSVNQQVGCLQLASCLCLCQLRETVAQHLSTLRCRCMWQGSAS